MAAQTFASWGRDTEHVELACLLVSEVVTNVVLHAAASAGRRPELVLEPAGVSADGGAGVGGVASWDVAPFGQFNLGEDRFGRPEESGFAPIPARPQTRAEETFAPSAFEPDSFAKPPFAKDDFTAERFAEPSAFDDPAPDPRRAPDFAADPFLEPAAESDPALEEPLPFGQTADPATDQTHRPAQRPGDRRTADTPGRQLQRRPDHPGLIPPPGKHADRQQHMSHPALHAPRPPRAKPTASPPPPRTPTATPRPPTPAPRASPSPGPRKARVEARPPSRTRLGPTSPSAAPRRPPLLTASPRSAAAKTA